MHSEDLDQITELHKPFWTHDFLLMPRNPFLNLNQSLGKFRTRQTDNIFLFIFAQKTRFDTACTLGPRERICMKCQIMCPEKSKKKIFIMSSPENFTNRAKP